MNILRAIWQRTRAMHTILLVVVVFTTGFAFGTQANLSAAVQLNLSDQEEQAFEAFWEAYELIRERYIEPVETEVLVEGALSGMLDAVGDQYTGYMPRDVYSLMNADISGEIEGIGVIIRTIEDTGEIEVANVLRGTPAEAAGIEIGDIFTVVDGEDVLGYNQLELATIVRGPRGSEVDLTMRRGEDFLDFSLTRERIPVPTSEHTVLDGNVGFIRLFEFTSQSRPQLNEAIDEMGEIDSLILDLRGNPGGTLRSSIEIASAFIEEGVIVREEFGDGRVDELNANGNFLDLDVPLVILVDEQSASASELVSGALQDTEAATIIGEPTFGKGTVQSWRGLANGGGVRITIARWLTPNGTWIDEAGIIPDVVVEFDPEDFFLDIEDPDSLLADDQLQAALEFLGTQEARVVE